MLRVYFGDREGSIRDSMIDAYFDNAYEDSWFEDEIVKEIVLDIDKTTIMSPLCMHSSVLGLIPPHYLSGGVKALITMLKTDNIVDATACGENCADWIVKIGDLKDLSIDLNYSLKLKPNEAGIFIENDNTIVYTGLEFLDKIILFCGGVHH